MEEEDVNKLITNGKVTIDVADFWGFGSNDDYPYCIVIKDIQEFVSRIEDVLKKEEYEYKMNAVTYYDANTYCGKVTQFMKQSKYSPQKEFRIWVKNNSNTTLTLNVGNIEDIAELIHPQEIIVEFEKC